MKNSSSGKENRADTVYQILSFISATKCKKSKIKNGCNMFVSYRHAAP